MKTIISLITVLIIALSLSACGCSNSTSSDTTDPGTTILPSILPTLDTNIPDPEIDTQLPMYTEGTDPTQTTGPIGAGTMPTEK